MTSHAKPETPPWLSVSQAAIACACSDDTIRRAVVAGHLSALKVGSLQVLDFKEVAVWGAARRLAAVGKLQDPTGEPIPYEAIAG